MSIFRRTEERISSLNEHGDWHCVGVFRDLGHIGGAGENGERCCNCDCLIHYETIRRPTRMTRGEYRRAQTIARAELGWPPA